MTRALLHINAQGRDDLGASYQFFDFFLTELPTTEAEGYALMERAQQKFAPNFAAFWLTGVSVVTVLPEEPAALSEAGRRVVMLLQRGYAKMLPGEPGRDDVALALSALGAPVEE